MKINILRKLDQYVLPWFCKFLLMLSSFSRERTSSSRGQEVRAPKSILIIKFFGMGTILLTLPALRELKRKHRDAKVTIFTLTSNREVCSLLSPIDDVICMDIKNPLSFLSSFFAAIGSIRKRHFDVVIDLEFLTNFSAFVTQLVTIFDGPKTTVGFSSPFSWRNRVHDINVCFDHSRHISKIFIKLFCSIGGEAFEPSFESEKAVLKEQMDREYMPALAEANPDLAACELFVCVNVNAGELSLHRRWPKEYFAEVVNALVRRPGLAVLLIGAKADGPYVAEFKKLLQPSSRVVDVCGKTDIRELIALFCGSDLLITNDGGPLHLAMAVGLPTVSFFGPETPHLYGPLDEEHCVFYEDLYCSPCLNIYNSKLPNCQRSVCLERIKPDRVLKVIEEKYLKGK